MSGTSAEFTLTLPISEQAFWTITLLFGLVVLSALIAWGLPKSKGGGLSPIDTICERLGLSHGFGPLVLLAVCGAMALGAAGLFTLVDFMKAALHMPPYHQVNDGAAIRNIGLVLAALLGAPFVIWRSYVAAKQARIQDEALFNDKINAAAADLSARRQVTRVVHHGTENEDILTEWQDDLVTRAAAIDRLEGLANERPDAIRRIARQLSIYVRELSRENPPKEVPSDDMDVLDAWAGALEPIRPDMESAVQTLGRLQIIPNHGLQKGDIDLRKANLQGFDLSELSFNDALFSESHLQGANLFLSQLQRAKFYRANLHRADLTQTDCNNANFEGAFMQGIYLHDADASRADFSWAKLHKANLSGSNFGSAFLGRADLSCGVIAAANLEDAILIGSDLRGADFRKVSLDQKTQAPKAIWRGAGLSHLNVDEYPRLELVKDDVFADGSVQLPDGATRPSHWADEELGLVEFDNAWQEWKSTLPAEALD